MLARSFIRNAPFLNNTANGRSSRLLPCKHGFNQPDRIWTRKQDVVNREKVMQGGEKEHGESTGSRSIAAVSMRETPRRGRRNQNKVAGRAGEPEDPGKPNWKLPTAPASAQAKGPGTGNG